jgi:carboxyl-terminal processing protease
MHKNIHHKIKKLGSFWVVKIILLAIVFSSGVYSGRYLLPVGVANAQDLNISMGTVTIQVSPEMKLYEQVKKILDDKYIKAGNIKEDAKAYGSIQGLVQSYGDPYTVFFPPTQAKEFKTVVSGTFSGVGMEVGIKDNVLTVISPLKGSPAEKAGIKPDDKILKINGTSTEGMAVDMAVNLIRGEKGTSVTLTTFRKGDKDTKQITIVRDTIDVPVVDTKTIKDTFVISIATFSETSAQKFQEALQEFAKSKKKNLVIDLRNNPGGYLEAAVLMSSFFFPSDKVIVSEDFTRTGQKNVHTSKGFNAIPADVHMVILVNKGSASASEIFAGAFQDYNRAKIMGEQSFGKGSVQEYMDLPDGTSLKVTVARWLTPLGFSISEHGITPDITVALKGIMTKGKVDSQLDSAVNVLDNWAKYSKYSFETKTQFDFDKQALIPFVSTTTAVTATSTGTTTGVMLQATPFH